jgi:hypothetical protein
LPVLDHQTECVAPWIYVPADGTITCPRCNARYPSTPERLFAAAFDAVLAEHMQRLAQQGAAILAAERGG